MEPFRPLPESNVRKFGESIMDEDWSTLEFDGPITEQILKFEDLLATKLNKFCPEKSFKLGNKDKPFITRELKVLDRRKNREYAKRGKSAKYLELREDFKKKYKIEAEKYVSKTLNELKRSNPGGVFSLLKRLGAGPGEHDNHGFTLPEHESKHFSANQSAEAIADHFALISQEYTPLDEEMLPTDVKEKLKSDETPPMLSEYEVWRQIVSSKKPKSGVPIDLPRKIIQEFSPELATPLQKIINCIFQSGEWPPHWKLEYITPSPKYQILRLRMTSGQ